MITIVEAAFAICMLCYIITIVAFAIGWKKTHYFEQHRLNNCSLKVAVVVVFKNEEEGLRVLLTALANQSCKSFQLVLVDDHSEDALLQVIEFFRPLLPPFTVIKASGHGKKSGLKEAVEACDAELIITTDADCKPVSMWVETIIDYYRIRKPDMILGPVKIVRSEKLFAKLQQVEFISLIASTGGSAGLSSPIMANGANMAFTKSAWNKVDNLRPDLHSGEDVFLLHAIKKNNGTIRFIKSRNALVYTEPAPNMHSFIRQRQRWTLKASGYTDLTTIATAAIVLMLNLAIVISFVGSFIDTRYLISLIALYVMKFFVDYGFLILCNRFFGVTNLFVKCLLISFSYPFYVVYSAATGLLYGNRAWK